MAIPNGDNEEPVKVQAPQRINRARVRGKNYAKNRHNRQRKTLKKGLEERFEREACRELSDDPLSLLAAVARSVNGSSDIEAINCMKGLSTVKFSHHGSKPFQRNLFWKSA